MNTTTHRIVLRALGLGALTVIAAAPWAGIFVGDKKNKPAQSQRKSTDAPIAPTGKLGQDLFFALDHRDLATLQDLIKKGADPNARNGLEFTPLYIAAASHQPQAMKALIDAGAKIDAESPYGSPLAFASATAHFAGAQMLISKGANVNVTRVDGIHPLMMAAYSGSPELVALLIKNKAKVNEPNFYEATALSYAARGGNVAAGKVLLDANAKVDSKDADGLTPLMWAAKTGRPEFAKLLIERGAKVNAKDKKGSTALHLAAAYGNDPELIKSLLEAGADKNAKDAKGRTAGDLASSRGFAECAEALGKPAAAKTKPAAQAIKSSLKLLELSMADFTNKTACLSCHQEGLGRWATAAARDRGFSLDPALAKGQIGRLRGALAAMKPLHEGALKNPEIMKQLPLIEINEYNTIATWILAGMAAQKDAPTAATAAMAQALARQQSPEGMWTFSLPRVPMQSSIFTFTALSVRSLSAYGPRAKSAENADRIAKAKAWLMKAPAQTSDDRAFAVLGLKWAGTTAEERKERVEQLLAAQLPDGGWSQMPNMKSDAYATGQALYALSVGGGISSKNAAFAKGIAYLLRTQDDDGSWFVNKRAIPANNYFDASFPHGESQYSSFNGTAWAMMALLETIEKK